MVRLGLEFPSSPSILLTASDIHSLQLFYFIFAKTLFVIFLPYHSSNCSNFFFPSFIYLFIFLRRAIALAWFSVIYIYIYTHTHNTWPFHFSTPITSSPRTNFCYMI